MNVVDKTQANFAKSFFSIFKYSNWLFGVIAGFSFTYVDGRQVGATLTSFNQ